VFLQSLTLKGFKSFAETTTISLAPGLSVIVGPNGSGKSNIVDAISWVLGSQSPTALRSQQMDDVIFAGNPGRAALGRAEVTLTFDNADRRLPLDLDEVAISRTLFRSGDSAYAINATQTRLIDIAEMLSAAGVGRHRHVIVSQGHIDAVLRAKPAERRAILEEAAGVSAYRVRKEKALRRLEDTEANLARLGDQLNEVRRALRPLERQASVARRHGALAAELAALQIHRLGAELGELRERRREAATLRRDLADRRAAANRELATLDGRIAEAEARLSAPDHVALATAGERLATLEDRVQQAQRAISRRQQEYERRRQGWLAGDLLASLGDESARIEAALGELDGAEAELSAERVRLDGAADALASAERQREQAVAAETAARRAQADAAAECNRWRARVDALALTLGDERAHAGMEVLEQTPGVLGALGELVTVEEGWEAAFEAAAGEALAAAVLEGHAAARPALEALVRARTAGAVLPAQPPGAGPPPVGRPLRPHVRGRAGGVDEVLDGLIGSVVVVPTWQEACDAVADHPDATIVTPAGLLQRLALPLKMLTQLFRRQRIEEDIGVRGHLAPGRPHVVQLGRRWRAAKAANLAQFRLNDLALTEKDKGPVLMIRQMSDRPADAIHLPMPHIGILQAQALQAAEEFVAGETKLLHHRMCHRSPFLVIRSPVSRMILFSCQPCRSGSVIRPPHCMK